MTVYGNLFLDSQHELLFETTGWLKTRTRSKRCAVRKLGNLKNVTEIFLFTG